jgi:putative hydrolase of the HAD superfamily
MLKAVLFDLDDTLMPDEAAANEALVATAALAKQWHNIPPADLKDSVRRVARGLFRAHPIVAPYDGNFDVSSWSALSARFDGEDEEMKQLSAWVPEYRHEVWSGALAENGIADPLLADTLSCVYMAERRARYQPFPDALQVLRELGRKFRLGLVTNGPSDLQYDKLDTSELRGCFGAVVVSREVGIAKPNPRIFAIALDRLGVTTSDAVFIGDNPKTDIAGAHAAGMKAIWLNRDNVPQPETIVPDRTIRSLAELEQTLASLQ